MTPPPAPPRVKQARDRLSLSCLMAFTAGKGMQTAGDVQAVLLAFDDLLTAAQHAAAACPRCGGRGEADAAGPGERVQWAPCAACAELRAAVAAAEGDA